MSSKPLDNPVDNPESVTRRGDEGRATGFVVTIDGPAGAGKSTTARQLAERLHYSFLDTGAIYRTVALCSRRRAVDWADGAALAALATSLDLRFEGSGASARVLVGDQDVTSDIRTPEISDGASRVSAFPEVRAALLSLQRSIGARGRIVAEGRDTGTVVFPTAAAKFFLTAPVQVRAERRTRELQAAGRAVDPAEVLREMELRDDRDRNRAVSPLRKADDAVEIDTATLSAQEVVDRMEAVVRGRGG
jgi:cytidylate kinase